MKTKAALVVVLAFYTATRLYALGALPAFLDESLYISWALEAWTFWRRVLASGKPLHLFVASLLVPWAPDPLWAMRGLSVAAGAAALCSVYVLGERRFGTRAAVLGAVGYIVCPFSLFYDRLAVGDAFLSAAAGWVLVLSLLVAEAATTKRCVWLGAALGIAILAKMHGVILLLTPLVVLSLTGASRHCWRKLWLPYAVAALTAGWPLWFFLGKSWEVQKAAAPGSLRAVVATVVRAMSLLGEWWTWGIVALAAIGLLATWRQHRPVGLALLWSLVAPVALVACAAETWYPRYLLFATPPTVALAGFGASVAVRHWRPWAALVVVSMYPALRLDLALLTDVANARLPITERQQYITGWASGYGLREAAEHVRRRAGETRRVITVVVPRSTDRTVFLGLRTYLRRCSTVRLVESAAPFEFRSTAGEVLVAMPPGAPHPPQAQLCGSWTRPDGSVAVELYGNDKGGTQ